MIEPFTQFILIVISFGVFCLVVYYGNPKTDGTLRFLEEENEKTKELIAYIDGFESPMEKLEEGVKHILGEDWFKEDSVEQTRSQCELTSCLLLWVLHHNSTELLQKRDNN